MRERVDADAALGVGLGRVVELALAGDAHQRRAGVLLGRSRSRLIGVLLIIILMLLIIILLGRHAHALLLVLGALLLVLSARLLHGGRVLILLLQLLLGSKRGSRGGEDAEWPGRYSP